MRRTGAVEVGYTQKGADGIHETCGTTVHPGMECVTNEIVKSNTSTKLSPNNLTLSGVKK